MLKQWICATTGKVLFTPKGRAFNRYAPSLGATASTSFLSLLYGQSHSRYIDQAKSERYTCFARSQVHHPLASLNTVSVPVRSRDFMLHILNCWQC